MPEQETVKVELELPKDNVHIQTLKTASSPTSDVGTKTSQEKIAELKQELATSKEEGGESSSSDVGEKAQSIIDKSPLDSIPAVKDKSPPNTHQKIVIAAGLIVSLVGLILWPLSNFVVALFVALIGATVVSIGTFVKV